MYWKTLFTTCIVPTAAPVNTAKNVSFLFMLTQVHLPLTFKIIILQPESQINPLIIFLQHGSYPADVFRHAGSAMISVSLICACFEKVWEMKVMIYSKCFTWNIPEEFHNWFLIYQESSLHKSSGSLLSSWIWKKQRGKNDKKDVSRETFYGLMRWKVI